MTTIGLLHPGEMGAAVGGALVRCGTRVLWASEGRSPATRDRAADEALTDAGSVAAVIEQSDVVLSVCPPHAAVDVAHEVAGFGGVYVDANAVAPATAASIGAIVTRSGATFVDGGIVGPPPRAAGDTRLFLSGATAHDIEALFAPTVIDAIVVEGSATAASAVKMTYAAWTKGTMALVLAIRSTARAHGVEDALLAEWARSQPELEGRAARAADASARKAWRWTAEMEEIARTFGASGLPSGFHEAAAAVFARIPADVPGPDALIDGLPDR